jgi:hypothetical protein
MPRPSSATMMTMWSPSWRASRRTTDFSGLPGMRSGGDSTPWSTALRIRWMIGIGQVLDHRLVDFGLLADQHQFDVLAEVAGEVAGDARILLEQAADRLHARLHHRVLQIRDQQVELAHGSVERMQRLGVGAAGEDVVRSACQAVLGQADFARQVEHLVEPRGIDADRIVASLLVSRRPTGAA